MIGHLVRKHHRCPPNRGNPNPRSAPTDATRKLDDARLDDMRAERDELRHDAIMAKARTKLPGSLDVNSYQRDLRIGELDNQIAKLEGGLKALDYREAERGRAMMNWPRVQELGPELLPDWRRPRREEFGPPAPPRPVERDTGAPYRDPASLRSPTVTPTIDPSATDALFQLGQKAQETGAQMQAALSVSGSSSVDTSGIDAALAKVRQLKAELASLSGSIHINVGGAGGTTPAKYSGHRSFAPAPAGRLQV